MGVYAGDDTLRFLHEYAVRLAPEWGEAGGRLLRHQDEWPMHERTAAYSVRGAHIQIRDYLRRRGEWPGHWGPTVVFVSEPTEGLLIHELGHDVDIEEPIADTGVEPTVAQREEQIAYLTAPHVDLGEKLPRPWNFHEASWVRRTLHLHWRSWQLGVEVGLPECRVAGPDYGLSPSWRYMHALGDEPTRMATASFGEIDATPMPDEFIKLWRDDIARYWNQRNAK